HYLANYGLEVRLLERATFPRDKVCGDGLAPRAVSEIVRMGIQAREEDGWHRNKRVRVYGGGRQHDYAWPVIERYPSYCARSARVIGVRAQPMDANGRRIRDAEETEFYAPVVMAADGVSARLATSLGIEKDENRPMGVAIRARFNTPRHDDAWMESHLELW